MEKNLLTAFQKKWKAVENGSTKSQQWKDKEKTTSTDSKWTEHIETKLCI